MVGDAETGHAPAITVATSMRTLEPSWHHYFRPEFALDEGLAAISHLAPKRPTA